MSHSKMSVRCSTSRREFRTSSTAMAGATLLGAISARSYAAENNTIKVALVGCGSRGTGAAAAEAMKSQRPHGALGNGRRLRGPSSAPLEVISKELGRTVDVPAERQFLGTDGYRKAIRLAGPRQRRSLGHAARLPADAPGVRGRKGDARVHGEVVCGGRRPASAACSLGRGSRKKNLTIAGGLMSRSRQCTEEVVQQIHDGAIGEVITAGPTASTGRWASR